MIRSAAAAEPPPIETIDPAELLSLEVACASDKSALNVNSIMTPTLTAHGRDAMVGIRRGLELLNRCCWYFVRQNLDDHGSQVLVWISISAKGTRERR